jgi:hypothetical protein
MSNEWAEPVKKDDARSVRALLERRPPAFKLTDTVRAAPCLTDAYVAIRRILCWMSSRCFHSM